MKKFRKIIEGQILQTALTVFIAALLFKHPLFADIPVWLLLSAVFSSLVHQLWVSFFWRTKLYGGFFSTHPNRWFLVYRIGFAIFAALRIASFFVIAFYDTGTLHVTDSVRIVVSIILLVLSGYAMYSVIAYFGVERALGSDHFFPENAANGFVKQGIFRITSNGMYTYAVLFIHIVALYADSPAALIISLFHHIHLWIHYFVTEKPDIVKIYGSTE
ncbi:MAG: methyltransferase [Leptospirales bacterium]